jgi:hypothetical protein
MTYNGVLRGFFVVSDFWFLNHRRAFSQFQSPPPSRNSVCPIDAESRAS